MKRIGVIIIGLLLAAPKASAFEPLPRQEVSLSYSYVTGPQFALFWGGIFAPLFSFGIYSLDDFYTTGQFSAQYHHSLGKRFMVGCALDYEWDGLAFKDKDDVRMDGMSSAHFATFLPSAKLYYSNRLHFSTYCKLQTGLMLAISPDTDTEDLSGTKVETLWAIQFVPIGMEFGGQDLRGFFELGLGTQGLLTCGIRKSF